MEALKADPRKWPAGDSYFTPWDIARLNHLYAQGRKKTGVEEIEVENTLHETFAHKLRKKLYKCLNLEPPSDEEGAVDEIKEIKTPPYSSGESEVDDIE